MLVVCEKCETRFHLSDAKVPAKGARVRCSRCKHAFFVAPPGTGKEEAIDEVVAEVTGDGGTPAPEPAHDLFDSDSGGAAPEPRQRPTERRADDRGSRDFEEDWEFNDDSHPDLRAQAEPKPSRFGEFDASALDPGAELSEPEIGTGDAGLIGEPEPEAPPAVEPPPIDPVKAIRAREAELDAPAADDLGSPEEWDFVGRAEVEPDPAELSESAVPFADEDGSASPSPVLEDSPTTPRTAQVEPGQLPWATRLAGLASIGGWLLVVLALSVGMSSVLTAPSGTGAAAGQPAEIAVSGLDLMATDVRGRLLENALVGDILVVSGNLENRGVTPDVLVIELPADEALGVDRQLDMAVEMIMAEIEGQ